MRSFHFLFLSALTLSASAPAWAQINLRPDTYQHSKRSWEAGPLSWDEFLGRPTTDTTVIELSWVFEANADKVRQGITTYHYARFKPVLDMTESWVRSEFRNPSSLKLCQTSFDLLELYGRKATREYAYSTEQDLYNVNRYYKNQYEHRFDDMVYDTQKGLDATKTDLYATAVTMELQDEHFDPTQVSLGESVGYWGLSVGYNMMGVLSDYFGFQPFGLCYSLDFGYKRHLWILDMGISFGGECKKGIDAHNGYIYQGDDINSGLMMLNWGYRVGNDIQRPCYPFVGVGAIFFDDIDAAYTDANGKKITPEKASFALGAGFIYDIPVRRHIYLYENSLAGRQSMSQNSIRIKPSLNLCHLSDIGWTPCLNLSISFDWASWNLK